MINESSVINGVHRFNLKTHHDNRGHFTEVFRKMWFTPPVYCDWSNLQMNVSHSKAGVLRGLHYHLKQVDYWYVADGNIQVGLIDIRENSETFQANQMIDLDGESGLFIPEGVAHGFLALTDCILVYLVNQYYDNTDEYNVDWKVLDWYSDDPILSERDG